MEGGEFSILPAYTVDKTWPFLPSSPVPERVFKFSVTIISKCMDKNKMLYKLQSKLVKN